MTSCKRIQPKKLSSSSNLRTCGRRCQMEHLLFQNQTFRNSGKHMMSQMTKIKLSSQGEMEQQMRKQPWRSFKRKKPRGKPQLKRPRRKPRRKKPRRRPMRTKPRRRPMRKKPRRRPRRMRSRKLQRMPRRKLRRMPRIKPPRMPSYGKMSLSIRSKLNSVQKISLLVAINSRYVVYGNKESNSPEAS